MSDNLTDTGEARTLNWLTGNTTTAPVLPLKLRLMTVLGNDATPGTEVVNAGGSSYAAQTAAFPAASGSTSTANSGDIVFTNMPAIAASPGIVGAEIWDSAGTPIRWWQGAATTPKGTNLGDTVRILAGTLVLTMQ
jgi:hypothetical protein